MASRSERVEQARIAGLVGAEEASRYAALFAVHRASGERHIGDVELLALSEVAELNGSFRPGLVAFAREGSGDYLAWDVRRGMPTRGGPGVVWCDHEIGMAEPFGRDVQAALTHLALREGVGVSGAEAWARLQRWQAVLEPHLRPADMKLLGAWAAQARRAPRRVLFSNEASLRAAAQPLIGKGRGGYCVLPPTHLPMLDPDSKRELRDHQRAYKESLETYREMVHVERRAGYGWYLAAAARGLADVALRLGSFALAAQAAREAIAHYTPVYDRGDTRCESQLAFAHRVLAVTDARARRFSAAYRNAKRALELYEASLSATAEMSEALGHVAAAWERERAHEDPYEVQLELNVAKRAAQRFAEANPPHALSGHAARIMRLAEPRPKPRTGARKPRD